MRWAVARSLLREKALQKEALASFSTSVEVASKQPESRRPLSSVALPQEKEDSSINIITDTVPG